MSEDPLDIIRGFDSELVDSYLDFQKELFEDGELSAKTKILMAFAIDAAKSATSGVRAYALRALEAGASWGEIKEAFRVAYYIGQGAVLWPSLNGLKDVVPK